MEINSLFSIVRKDLKLFTRPRFPALVILLAPVLIILFAGIVFDSSDLSGIIIAVYSDTYTDLTEDLLKDFEEQKFAIKKFDSQQNCIESVKSSKTQICMVFPDDLSATGSLKDVIFYVDHSRLNLAYSLINEVETKISSKASNLGVALAQDLVDILNSVKDSLPEQNVKISNSRNKLNQINEKASETFSSSDVDNALNYLDDAKDLLGENSEAEGGINDAIKNLQSIKNLNLQASSNLNDIGNRSEEVDLLLKDISNNLDVLINSINGINVLEAEKIISPIKTRIEPISTNSNNRDYLLPTIIALIALFGSVLLSSTFVLKEKKTKAFFRNFITPTWDTTFIFGTYLTCLIILSIQFLLIFAGINWILKMPILPVLSDIVLVLFISLSVFIFLGMFIGYLFRSEETTIFAAVLTASVLMFFSNTILPIETISNRFNDFAIFNPLVISELALKKIMLFDFNISAILPELYVLGGFFFVFALLTYISRRVTKRML
jgi:hypothetical protein|tara:strand:+ start:4175 stop:5656 length:1482 start_codon:yes stop_codon:yes gene_type:complete